MTEPHYDIRESKDGHSFYFVLLAANGEPVSTSELYTTKADAERGIEAARKASAESGDGDAA